jgi:anti-sigma B factor antagonist
MTSPATLRLDGELTIYTAQETRLILLQSLAGLADDPTQTVLQIDLSGVSEVDTAGMQLLMAARQQAQAQDKDVRLVGHGPAVTEVIELLGLPAYFADPAAADNSGA